MGSLSTDSFFSRSLACANKPGSADFLSPVIQRQVAVYARPRASTSAHLCVWIKRVRPRIPCAKGAPLAGGAEPSGLPQHQNESAAGKQTFAV